MKNDANLYTAVAYDKIKTKEMEQTIETLKKQLLIIANEQKNKIHLHQARHDFKCRAALEVAGLFD